MTAPATSAGSPPGARMDGVRLDLDGTPVLRGTDLDLPGGAIHGLLGRNGAGKTTLLSVLAGFVRADAGSVLVGGRPVFENGSVTRDVCLVRADSDLPDDIGSVDDFLRSARALRTGWSTAYEKHLADRFELPRKRAVKALSQGQRAMLGTVYGLASRAPLTLLDECHLGMDAHARKVFTDELLADIAEHPRTVVISSHLIDEMGPLFADVAIVHRGRILLQDDADALRARGAAVTGPAEAVERFTAGETVLGERRLGGTVQAVVYGELDEGRRREAAAAGLELGPIGLQELFVHLTTDEAAGPEGTAGRAGTAGAGAGPDRAEGGTDR
ncbi:ATP-binding cassette domain-containing protein [Nocardiopsis coralliicola]